MPKETREDNAYRLIVQKIVQNRFKPGDYLLETELAHELKLSRTPVRQALGRLIAEGFLEKKPKKGCVIPIPTAEDAEMVCDARCMVEGEAAALSSIRASRAELENLRKILEDEADVARRHDKDAYSSINEKFHLGIARTSGNIYIQNYCRHMLWRSNLYVYFFDAFYHHMDKEKLLNQESPGQHKMVLAAIEKNEPEMAKEAMKDHIKFQFRNLLPVR